jgi:hypothetical protein
MEGEPNSKMVGILGYEISLAVPAAGEPLGHEHSCKHEADP